MKFAFEEALRHLGQFLPSIEQLRAYSEQWKPVDPIAETRRILARDDKPTDWQELGRKSGITSAEIAEWLEEGKAKQRAHIATLEADPEWRKFAGRAGVPAHRSFAEWPVESQDPEERKHWAHEKAIEMGWLVKVREPRDEA